MGNFFLKIGMLLENARAPPEVAVWKGFPEPEARECF
jgi:hypothetical protein